MYVFVIPLESAEEIGEKKFLTYYVTVHMHQCQVKMKKYPRGHQLFRNLVQPFQNLN